MFTLLFYAETYLRRNEFLSPAPFLVNLLHLKTQQSAGQMATFLLHICKKWDHSLGGALSGPSPGAENEPGFGLFVPEFTDGRAGPALGLPSPLLPL